ncbi:multiple sugar transport system substrate-binding protein [Lentzea atacamensis]|uniref:Multiple sugar transport system substrate-binding protein n=2 Tax=Lentzea TaxID=165301 RepID=A0A316HIE6_9PSEU|nr:sugar ABC transporter substrate-binding protein [Lentzea atacamensis]PWK81024.1 multiple sugar transport system substrate-binding protein [Lentzea atacamensis]
MKRTAALVAACTVATLTGCGAQPGDDAVTLWMYPVIADQAQNRAYWQKVEAGFEAEHGLKVRIELQPWESRQEKLGAALMAGSGPDVVLLQPDMIPQYVEEKALLPVGDVLKAGDRQYRPSAITALTVGDQTYGLPLYQTVTTTVYNRKLFTEAGITELPDTWDEVRAAAPKLAAKGVPVLDYAGSTEETLNMTFYPLLWQAGGSVFNEEGTKSAFSSAQGVDALRFLVDLNAMGGLPRDAATKRARLVDDAVAAGKAAMSHSMVSTTARNVVRSAGAENTVVGAPLRHRAQVTFGQPGALSLLRTAKNPDAARKFLSYMTTPKVIEELCVHSGFFLPWTGATPPVVDDVDKGFAQALEFARAGDTHPQARKVMGLLAPHLQAALLGERTPEQALADAAVEVDALLQQKR